MRGDKLSQSQLMALLWAGLLAPAAELLPGRLLGTAGSGAWLAVLLAAPVVLASGRLLAGLGGGAGPARGFTALLGRGSGRARIILYMVWGQLLLALRLRLGALRLLSAGERDGAVWFFLAVLAAFLVWMGRGSLAAFARAGQLFLAALLACAAVVLGLSAAQARPERLLPLGWGEGLPLLRGGLAAAGVLGWGLFAAFLLGDVEDRRERRGRYWLSWCLGGVALLALAQAVILGNLGVRLAARLDAPFFALAKSVGVEGAFQRVESIVAALWSFADLVMGGVLLFALRAMGREALPRRWEGRLPWIAVLLGAAGALTLFREQGTARRWNGEIVPVVNLVLALGVPAALETARRLWRGRGRPGTSCGPNTGETTDVEGEKKSRQT